MTTDQPRRTAKRGAALYITGGVTLLLLLSLPVALLALPDGIHLGKHGVSAFIKISGVPVVGQRQTTPPSWAWFFSLHWKSWQYRLDVW